MNDDLGGPRSPGFFIKCCRCLRKEVFSRKRFRLKRAEACLKAALLMASVSAAQLLRSSKAKDYRIFLKRYG